MTNLQDLKELLQELDKPNTIMFESPDYASAVIGLTDDDCLVYSYEKMIQHLVNGGGMSEEEAIEFIDYNTIRALPYAGELKPIIVYDTLFT